MPRLTKEQLQDVKYLSLIDFTNQIGRYNDVEDKRNFAIQYLLTYGMKENPDYSLAEAIHFVRIKLSETIDEEKADFNTQIFLANPVKYLKVCSLKELAKIDPNSNLISDDKLASDYLKMSNALNNDTANEVERLDQTRNSFDVKTRMSIRMGGQRALDKLIKNTKPGFFSKLFNTSSEQAKNLDRVYKEFNNPDSNSYGNLDRLEEAGLNYLAYKFPKLNVRDKLPSLDAISGLDKTSKARALFSIRAIEAARSQREVEYSLIGLNDLKDINVEELLSQENNVLNDELEKAKTKVVEKKIMPKEPDINNKDEMMKKMAEADKAKALKDLKEGEEMDLSGDEFPKPKEDDSEVYAYDEEIHPSKIELFNNTFEKEVVKANDEIGESFLEPENIKKEKELELLQQQMLEKQLKDDLKEDSEIVIHTEEIEKLMKEHKYYPQKEDLNEEKYEPSILKKYKDDEVNDFLEGMDSADFTENQIADEEQEEMSK